MDSSRRALSLVRLVAVCLLAIGVLQIVLCLIPSFNPSHPQAVKILPLLTNSIPLVIGVVILVKSRALAEWLADLLE